MDLGRLDRLWSIVESQEGQIRQLQAYQETLRLENRALRSCLRATGCLSEHQFQAELLQAQGATGTASSSPVLRSHTPSSPRLLTSPRMGSAIRGGTTATFGVDSIRGSAATLHADPIRDLDNSLEARARSAHRGPVRTAIREGLTPRRLKELEFEASELAEDAREVVENSVISGLSTAVAVTNNQELEDVRQRVYRASFNAKLRDLEGLPATSSIMQDEQWPHEVLAPDRDALEARKYEGMTFQSVSSLLPAWNTDCGSPKWPQEASLLSP